MLSAFAIAQHEREFVALNKKLFFNRYVLDELSHFTQL